MGVPPYLAVLIQSDHRVVAGRPIRLDVRLDDVPMLDDATVLEAEVVFDVSGLLGWSGYAAAGDTR